VARNVVELIDVATREELETWESKLAFVAAALAGSEWMAASVDGGLEADIGVLCIQALALRKLVRERLQEMAVSTASQAPRAGALGFRRTGQRRQLEGVAR
jgi:hypothetical protein